MCSFFVVFLCFVSLFRFGSFDCFVLLVVFVFCCFSLFCFFVLFYAFRFVSLVLLCFFVLFCLSCLVLSCLVVFSLFRFVLFCFISFCFLLCFVLFSFFLSFFLSFLFSLYRSLSFVVLFFLFVNFFFCSSPCGCCCVPVVVLAVVSDCSVFCACSCPCSSCACFASCTVAVWLWLFVLGWLVGYCCRLGESKQIRIYRTSRKMVLILKLLRSRDAFFFTGVSAEKVREKFLENSKVSGPPKIHIAYTALKMKDNILQRCEMLLGPYHQRPSNVEFSTCLWDSNNDAMQFCQIEGTRSSINRTKNNPAFGCMQRLLLMTNALS